MHDKSTATATARKERKRESKANKPKNPTKYQKKTTKIQTEHSVHDRMLIRNNGGRSGKK